jgi:hypothetical protein
MQGSYFWLRMTRLYTKWLQSYQRKDRLSHYPKLTSLSAFGSILKVFFLSVSARVVLSVGDDLTLYMMVTIVRKDRLSYYQKLTSLSAFGSILKDFFGNRCR